LRNTGVGEVIGPCSEIRTKHMDAYCGQNVEFLSLPVCEVVTGL